MGHGAPEVPLRRSSGDLPSPARARIGPGGSGEVPARAQAQPHPGGCSAQEAARSCREKKRVDGNDMSFAVVL